MSTDMEPIAAVCDDLSSLTAGLVADEERRQNEASQPVGPTILPDDLLPGVGEPGISLREAIRTGGPRLIVVLSLLNFLDEFDRTAVTILGPDIQRSLGLSDAGLGAALGVGALVFTLAAVPLGVAADRRKRTPIVAASGLVAAVFSALTGSVQAVWQFVVVRLAGGIGQSSVLALHNSLLSDGYPLQARGSVLGVHNGAPQAAKILAPVAAGGLAAIIGGAAGWRWPFLVSGILIAVVAIAAFTLREPPRGAGELFAVTGDVAVADADTELHIPVGAGVERLLKIQTLRFLLLGLGVLGVCILGVPTFFFLLLKDEYGLGSFQRGVVGSLINIGGLVGIPLGGIIGQRLFRKNPPSAVLFVGACQLVFAVVFALAMLLHPLPLLVIAIGVSNVIGGLALVPIYAFVSSVAPYRLRGLAFALVGLFVVLIGGLLGNVVLGAISDSSGPRNAMLIMVPAAAVIGGGLAAYGARFVRQDLSLVVEELREEKDEAMRVLAGGDVAMLQVRNLDFSYGPVQVLFDVSVDVRRGEVLALLGTNGAGKSTLLRAITGLQLPDRGVVRMDGRTITYLGAEQRVDLGIVQVPGGKAVFPSMTVADNLLAGAHRFIWDQDLVERRIEDSLDLFPRLRERLDQPAGTLSGGEQQQLAIAKALLLDPQLLCIDELSLGLAPIVVQDILATVEKLKERGVTMVIVEQSVNVALSIADRAVFMEKGQVRFEGPAAELLERDDLIRAVFLGGGEGG